MKAMIKTETAFETMALYRTRAEVKAQNDKIQEAFFTLWSAGMINDDAYNKLSGTIRDYAAQHIQNRNE